VGAAPGSVMAVSLPAAGGTRPEAQAGSTVCVETPASEVPGEAFPRLEASRIGVKGGPDMEPGLMWKSGTRPPADPRR
jgi:hypothetical protein